MTEYTIWITAIVTIALASLMSLSGETNVKRGINFFLFAICLLLVLIYQKG